MKTEDTLLKVVDVCQVTVALSAHQYQVDFAFSFLKLQVAKSHIWCYFVNQISSFMINYIQV